MRFEFLPAFGGECFLIHGGTAEEPVLILVDGGPPGTYQRHLLPRLTALREQRGLDELSPLVIDLVVVSQSVDDHIAGIVDLFADIRNRARALDPPLFEVRGLWHNSFDSILGDEKGSITEQFGAVSFAPFIGEAPPEDVDTALILQSVSHGHELRALAAELDIPVNDGFDGLIRARHSERVTRELGGITLTVIGPRTEDLHALEQQYSNWRERQKKAGPTPTLDSMFQSLNDASAASLASMALLIESGGRRALLTAATRSDMVARGLQDIGLMPNGSLDVDLLQLPHQGSARNLGGEFLQQVTAQRYVFTGNGERGTPDRETLEMLAGSGPERDIELCFVEPLAEIDVRRKTEYQRILNRLAKRSKGGSDWSDAAHSLMALVASLPPGFKVLERSGPTLMLDIEGQQPPELVPARTEDSVETYTEFVSDNAEVEVDCLDRGVLAISLGRQLHRIWRKNNGLDVADSTGRASTPAKGRDEGAFVLHLDAPWGGGKTTFAHFLARVLNPYGGPSQQPPRFLTERYGEDFNLGKLFIEPEFGPDSCRPWITVWFNAWQAEDCQPPWWVFYQAIRKGCFDAIADEGDEPIDLDRKGAPLPQPDWERGYKWRRLVRDEYWWRLRDPKIVTPFAAALVSIILALLLWSVGALAAETRGAAFAVGNGLGFVLAAVTGIGALWGIGTFVTESVAPGTNSLAERLSLGSADPFSRFRDHFAQTMQAVRRPVMVVVDDLDRCKPEFIVNLMRGIQILLRSPRVVFVILGDRDWIERAFEKHHEALSKVNVGPEQSLGARFVEKTIQMSFILPGMTRVQETYVQRILGHAPPEAADAAEKKPERVLQVREAVKLAAAQEGLAVLDSDGLRDKALEVVAAKSGAAPEQSEAQREETETAIRQLVDEEVAIHVSADESAERETVHLLEELARYFPPNPRQIKRIVNAMTTYRAMAMHIGSKERPSESLGPARLTQLAIWVTLMTEWPETWRLLASCPELADAIADEEDGVEKRIRALPAHALPGSAEATIREVQRIREDDALRGLIIGDRADRAALDSNAIRDLYDLTPLYRGRRRLAEAEEKPLPAKPQSKAR